MSPPPPPPLPNIVPCCLCFLTDSVVHAQYSSLAGVSPVIAANLPSREGLGSIEARFLLLSSNVLDETHDRSVGRFQTQ